MQTTESYNIIFEDYPDVVGVEDMRRMLGNVSKKAVYKLIRDKKIEAFKIGKEYKIPKLNIMVYLKVTNR